MLVLNLDEKYVWLSHTSHPQFEIHHGWLRSDFETEFGVKITKDLITGNYEPDRGLYIHTIGNLGNTIRFEKVDDDPFFDWVDKNIHSIITSAINAQFPDYEFDGSSWIITPEKQDEIDKRTRVRENVENLRTDDLKVLNFMMTVWEMGKSKGLWTDQDLPTEIRGWPAKWQGLIDDIKNDNEGELDRSKTVVRAVGR